MPIKEIFHKGVRLVWDILPGDVKEIIIKNAINIIIEDHTLKALHYHSGYKKCLEDYDAAMKEMGDKGKVNPGDVDVNNIAVMIPRQGNA